MPWVTAGGFFSSSIIIGEFETTKGKIPALMLAPAQKHLMSYGIPCPKAEEDHADVIRSSYENFKNRLSSEEQKKIIKILKTAIPDDALAELREVAAKNK